MAAKVPIERGKRKRVLSGVSVLRTPEAHSAIRHVLLAWFRKNARRLPWRGAGDPYAIWVSEVMLQQTQVATVIPYYQRFLQAFPSLAALAAASQERVFELWSGLGYYRRARYLHFAAQAAAEKFGGQLPGNYDGLRSLPGIGDYTAKAILSIAFNQPFAVLDGNVARVIARLCGLRGNLHQSHFRATVEAELDALLSRQQPGAFNQAVMELGQTRCLPRAPRCIECPLAKWCSAYQSGNPEEFPLPRPRRATERHHLAVALIRCDNKVAMVRGLSDGLLGDLWNFPAAFGSSPAEAMQALVEKLALLTGAPTILAEPLAEFRHSITYRAIHGRVYPAEITRHFRHSSLHWLDLTRLPQAAISQLARKIVHKTLPLIK